jgi:hypothetical protein
MNSLLQKLIGSLFLILISITSYAKVYVYEVTTDTTRFQTASKLPPDAFLYYNGGKDIIKKLMIVQVYDDNKFKEALKDYKLEKANENRLLHKKPPDNNISTKPFIWWR